MTNGNSIVDISKVFRRNNAIVQIELNISLNKMYEIINGHFRNHVFHRSPCNKI